MEDDDGFDVWPAAAVRSSHLLSRYTLERLALSGRVDEEGTAIILEELMDTCHGCGSDLPRDDRALDFLCPRCRREAVWLRN